METEICTARKLVCQDFQILLHAEVEIPVPKNYPRIRSFYETLSDTILRWAAEQEGERLRKEYLAKDVRERARYRTKILRVQGETLQAEQGWYALVCRAKRIGQTEAESTCALHIWNLSEQTLLPPAEILSRFRDVRFEKYFTKRYKHWKKHLKKQKQYGII